MFCFGCPAAWTSRRLVIIALSTAHAEYMAMGIGVRESLWMRSLLCDILGTEFVVKVLCDNQAAIKVCTDDGSNKKVRHTEREFYVSNQAYYWKQINIQWVPTKLQFANVFTKALTPVLHLAQCTIVQTSLPSSGGVL
jgi:hypothetical protein